MSLVVAPLAQRAYPDGLGGVRRRAP